MHEGPTNPFSPSLFLWLLRALWLGLAVSTSAAISNAGEDTVGFAGIVGPAVWFAVLALVAMNLVVVGPVGLTVVRVVTPATVPAAVVAFLHDDGVAAVVTVALGVLATLIAFSGEIGEAMAQGSAYGDERRFPLRTPAAMVVPVVLSWVVWWCVALGAVVALAHESWVLGVVLTAMAAVLTWFLGRRFHRLSRRWLVLVPAGVVVHDPVLLGETLMVQLSNVAHVSLAYAGTEAADLTGPAGGHALEIVVKDTVLAVFPTSKRDPKGRAIHVQSFLVAPSRPGRALRAMTDARLPVG